MVRVLAVLIASAIIACGRIDFDETGVPWLPGYQHRKAIVLVPPTPASLDDFTASIAEAADPDLERFARADGSDLTFTAADGVTPLAFEITSYASTTGALDAWVRLPTFRGDGPTTIYLYFDGPPTSSPDSAWSPAYAGVWHTDLCDVAVDSTAAQHDAQAGSPAAVPTRTAGIVGFGCSFDGDDDSMFVTDPPDASLDFGTASFSFSTWVFVTQSVNQSDIPLHKGGSSPATVGYDIELGLAPWVVALSDGVTLATAQVGVETDFLGRWVQIVAVTDRTAHTFTGYANAVPGNTIDITTLGSIDTGFDLSIGRAVNLFHGIVDEPRIYRVALSPEWIATEHANLADRDAVVQIGSLQAR